MKKLWIGTIVLLMIAVSGLIYAESCGVVSSRKAASDWVIGKCADNRDFSCSWDKRQRAWNCNGRVHPDISIAANVACCR